MGWFVKQKANDFGTSLCLFVVFRVGLERIRRKSTKVFGIDQSPNQEEKQEEVKIPVGSIQTGKRRCSFRSPKQSGVESGLVFRCCCGGGGCGWCYPPSGIQRLNSAVVVEVVVGWWWCLGLCLRTRSTWLKKPPDPRVNPSNPVVKRAGEKKMKARSWISSAEGSTYHNQNQVQHAQMLRLLFLGMGGY